MNATLAQHPWSSDALFAKALVYVGEMERLDAGDWRYGLWSSLSLELLARAALASISPVLLANGKADWRNIQYALGQAPIKKDFVPNAVLTREVISMLRELLPDFTTELAAFCIQHCGNRNAELHTGEERFAGLNTSEWLPKYYACCDVLLQSMGKNLDGLFADPKVAEQMISSLKDTAAKAVAREIELFKKAWNEKSPEDQKQSLAQATLWATRQAGHRVDCPVCGGHSLVKGTGWGPVSTEIDDESGLIIQRQKMLPVSFECIACGLKIAGLSKLSACGLGAPFTDKTTRSAADYFDLHTDEELEELRALATPEFEEDFNEG